MPPLTSYIRRNVRPEYPILGRIDEIDRIMAETCSGEDRCFVVIEGDKGNPDARFWMRSALKFNLRHW